MTISVSKNQQLPGNIVAPEFGEVNVRNTGAALEVNFTILMEPQGEAAEGWTTGVAIDASASMKSAYGRKLEGKVPANIMAQYQKKGWIESRLEDGNPVTSFQKQAYQDAINKGYFRPSPNVIQPLAREFTAYLASHLDAKGGTSLIYWACDRGSELEVIGDFTEAECLLLKINGPSHTTLGEGTKITPAVKYFVDRFVQAKRGMYIFITDGRIDDMEEIRQYTLQLTEEIAIGKRNSIKCVLIGVGDQIEVSQLAELDDLETGNGIDIWDHKIAEEMQGLIEIFAEVVNENQIVAPTGAIYDDRGNLVKKYTDGLPAKLSLSLPPNCQWFELEAYGNRIRQTLVIPQKPGTSP
ncbi:vWA domain-containing protein [Roseofilum casamattae]|uniref:VWA domain-containing protein n=1 Tax=Roseofilum casamattae BLCC-M143 TaxID=3022442 RepID=A0ABT7BUS8_9CYAN|nr:VWA domain-containing protein [Roseofilum casamattae]MDJ1182949.1 VWA domain-containing protein [Roseofilum casamattae BLCC-M143]